MIRELSIKNFKSIRALKTELGRVNVLIGENGGGKSNILEALALASAASQDKLDNEFLAARGIRVTEPRFMRAAFDEQEGDRTIDIELRGDGGTGLDCSLRVEETATHTRWVEAGRGMSLLRDFDRISRLIAAQPKPEVVVEEPGLTIRFHASIDWHDIIEILSRIRDRIEPRGEDEAVVKLHWA